MESLQHKQACRFHFAKLERQGYRVINLDFKSPDGIAIKDGKVYAVEVLGIVRRNSILTNIGPQKIKNSNIECLMIS